MNPVRITVTPDTRKLHWTVRVNGKTVAIRRTEFVANNDALMIGHAFEAVGMPVTLPAKVRNV